MDQFIQTLVVAILVVLPDNCEMSYKHALPKLSHEQLCTPLLSLILDDVLKSTG